MQDITNRIKLYKLYKSKMKLFNKSYYCSTININVQNQTLEKIRKGHKVVKTFQKNY